MRNQGLDVLSVFSGVIMIQILLFGLDMTGYVDDLPWGVVLSPIILIGIVFFTVCLFAIIRIGLEGIVDWVSKKL